MKRRHMQPPKLPTKWSLLCHDLIDDKGDRDEKLRTFAAQFVERAFRRPLTDELRQTYVESQFAAAKNLEEGIRRIVLLASQVATFPVP